MPAAGRISQGRTRKREPSGCEAPLPPRGDQETPAGLAAKIRACGYAGQERAVRAVSLFAYRHLHRTRRLKEGRAENLPKKTNLLFVGPTGCGKTHLVELLFGRILGLPSAVIDITAYSETGYVGLDISNILTGLLFAANMDPQLAETGVVCLDEFDKIAMSDERNTPTGGNGSSKDVTGFGVQRELLKMVEGTSVRVPRKMGLYQYDADHVDMSTVNIPFIACGAFSGLKSCVGGAKDNLIGFARGDQPSRNSIAVSHTEDDMNLTATFQRFGFLPELIGRFSRVVPFEALGAGELRDILERNVIPGWRNEMAGHGIEMVVDGSMVDFIVASALKRETGARSVESAVAQLMEDAAFDAYSCPGTRQLILNTTQGRPGYCIKQ